MGSLYKWLAETTEGIIRIEHLLKAIITTISSTLLGRKDLHRVTFVNIACLVLNGGTLEFITTVPF